MSSARASPRIQKGAGKARAISNASCSGSRATGPTSSAPTPVVTRRWRRERVAWASVTLASLIAAASVLIRPLPRAGTDGGAGALPDRAACWQPLIHAVARRPEPGLHCARSQRTHPNSCGFVRWIRSSHVHCPARRTLSPRRSGPRTVGSSRSEAGGKLKKIDVTGGLPQIICERSSCGSWRHVESGRRHCVRRRPNHAGVGGRRCRDAAHRDRVARISSTRSPHSFRTGVISCICAFPPDGNQGIYVGSLDATPEQQSTQRLLDTPLMPTYAPSLDPGAGHLLFVRDGTLWSQPFDARRLALAGEAVPVAERVGIFRLGANFSTSANGVLAYRSVGTALSRLTWYDRAGTVLGPAGDQGAYWDVALSPDDSRVATTLDEGRAAGPGISVLELARRCHGAPHLRCRLRGTSHLSGPRTGAASPSWPDAPGGTGVFQKPSSTGGKEQVLLPPTSAHKWTNDWSRDGHFLLFSSLDPKTKSDLWVLPLTGDGGAGRAARALPPDRVQRAAGPVLTRHALGGVRVGRVRQTRGLGAAIPGIFQRRQQDEDFRRRRRPASLAARRQGALLCVPGRKTDGHRRQYWRGVQARDHRKRSSRRRFISAMRRRIPSGGMSQPAATGFSSTRRQPLLSP